MKETAEQRKKRLNKQTYDLFFRITLMLAIPAVISVFVGKFVDSSFDIKPYGSLITFAVFNILTWVALIVYAKRFIIDK